MQRKGEDIEMSISYGTEKPKSLGELKGLLEEIAADLSENPELKISGFSIYGNTLTYSFREEADSRD